MNVFCIVIVLFSYSAKALNILQNSRPAPYVGGTSKKIHIIYPGGGIFFYWQAGVITYLREAGYDLSSENISHIGASAGALCSTLTATNVDLEKATALALKKASLAGVWDRPLGLMGIWGGIIESWLDELITDEGFMKLSDGEKLALLVTKIPSFQKKKISKFESKQDLIRANMASVHIPFFLNGKLTTEFRSRPHIDGSFLANINEFKSSDNTTADDDIIVLDWKLDPYLSKRNLGDAVTALSEEGIWDLLERGRKYAMEMEKRGAFQSVAKVRRR